MRVKTVFLVLLWAGLACSVVGNVVGESYPDTAIILLQAGLWLFAAGALGYVIHKRDH